MGMELLGGRQTDEGMAITFATDRGIEVLEGTYDEVARLAEVMKQVSVLATLNDHESVWVEDVAIGDAVVQFGLNPGGDARVRILRP
jgi:hypothetical protein